MAQLLAQQYELDTVIGRGPTGEVWRAVHFGTRDLVAVKVLDQRFADDPATVERFVRERQVLMAFLHPTFVRVRDLITGDGVLALVMEYIAGSDLRRHLGSPPAIGESMGAQSIGGQSVGGPSPTGLPVPAAAAVGLRLAEALTAAHDAGVVHCDLKPSNVLFHAADGTPRVTDCRVARLAYGFAGPSAWYTSPEYVAPEVIDGGPPLPATDLYALGLMLYEMLVGVPPYRGADPDAVLAGHRSGQAATPMTVPPHLRRLIEECLDPDPVARPSAREAALRLEHATTSPVPQRRAARQPTGQQPTLAPVGQPSGQQPAGPQPSGPQPVGPQPVGQPSASQRIAWEEITASTVGAADARAASGGAIRANAPGASAGPGRSAGGKATRGRGRRGLALAGGAAAAAIAVVVAIVLATTGNDAPQAGTPETGASTSPPQPINAAPAPPTLAASASAESREGATAFAYHWFDALNYAVSTGDIAALQAASSPQCRACGDAATTIRDGYRDQATLRGGTYTVRTVSADDFWSLESPALRVVFDRSPRSAIGPDGALVEVVPGGSFLTCQIVLERDSDGWRVLEVLSPEPIV